MRRAEKIVPIKYANLHSTEDVIKLINEAQKEAAIEFCLHIVGQLKCNSENKPSYDENSNESFIIMLPSTIHKRYELFLKSLEQ